MGVQTHLSLGAWKEKHKYSKKPRVEMLISGQRTGDSRDALTLFQKSEIRKASSRDADITKSKAAPLPNWSAASGWCLRGWKDKQTGAHTQVTWNPHTHTQPWMGSYRWQTESDAHTWIEISLGSQCHLPMSRLSRLREEIILFPSCCQSF